MSPSPTEESVADVEGVAGVADVAVLEVEPEGHRLHYVAHLVRAAGPGRCVVLTTDQAVRSRDYGLVSQALADATTVLDDADSPATALASAISAARSAGIRRLVVPDGDRYLAPLLLRRVRHPASDLEIRLLLLRTAAVSGPERPRPATLIKPLLVRALRRFRHVEVFFLTDALGVVESRRGYPGVRPVQDAVLRPGPQVPDRPDWLPPSSGSMLIGVFGVIEPRKNLPVLVQAVSRFPDGVLVVAGRLDRAVRQFVDTDATVAALRSDGRMVVVDRMLDADELAGALAGVDVVAVLHDNDSPSGILAEACVRGTPSLVPEGGLLAQVVDATGIGVACPLDPSGVAEGLRRVRADDAVLATALRRAADRIGTTHFTDVLLGRP